MLNSPGTAEITRNFTQALAFLDPTSALEMSAEILVSQVEPAWSTQPGCIFNDIPALIQTAPAGFGVCQPSQGIADGIQVGTDIQPIMLEVIPSVDDDGQILRSKIPGE